MKLEQIHGRELARWLSEERPYAGYQTDGQPSYGEALRIIALLQRHPDPAKNRGLRRHRHARVSEFFGKVKFTEVFVLGEDNALSRIGEGQYTIGSAIAELFDAKALDRVRQCPVCRNWFFAARKTQRWCQRRNKPYPYHLPRPKKGSPTIRQAATVLCGQRAYRALTPKGRWEWAKIMGDPKRGYRAPPKKGRKS